MMKKPKTDHKRGKKMRSQSKKRMVSDPALACKFHYEYFSKRKYHKTRFEMPNHNNP